MDDLACWIIDGVEYNVIKNLMSKDGSLDQEIYDLQCHLRRDTTIEEEEAVVYKMLSECKERCGDLSCSLTEAYKDIMY